jgi:serine/threonine protein kinase
VSKESNRPLPRGFELEQYRIERKISQGGFSIVYLALDDAGTRYAIKEYLPAGIAQRVGDGPVPVVPAEMRQAFNHGLKSFFEEARLLARINHPSVVRVLNFFRANETAYLVMPYESGMSLQQYLRKPSGASDAGKEAFLREVFVRLLSGLREVHTRKLLHLDIKPANIFLRRDGAPMLLDFGATRLGLGTADTVLVAVITPGYAAPEQDEDVSKEALGPWTDIYAVGATLYFCLAGVVPLRASERVKEDRLEPIAIRERGRYSPQLLDLIDWCLKLKTSERPQSVFVLQKVLGGELLDLVDPNWFPAPVSPADQPDDPGAGSAGASE